MSSRLILGLAAAGLVAIAAAPVTASHSMAGARSAATTEFSADPQKEKEKQQNTQIKRQENKQQNQQIRQEHKDTKQGQKVIQQQRHETIRQEHKVQQIQKQEFKQELKRREFTRSGKNGVVVGGRLRGLPGSGAGRFALHGQNYSAWRGGYRHRGRDGRWETFVALGALGVLAIGAAEYYPYAYIDAPQPFCEGLTEDGCQLDFQDVQTMEGDVVGQCVAYCPWQ
jgi:hypothetical protein